MTAHRPDLYAQMDRLVREAFVQMRKVSVIAMFIPRMMPSTRSSSRRR